MRQHLPDDWTLNLDPAFSRRETDDGFTVFSRPGLEIWTVVYGEQPFDPEAAVRSYLEWRNLDEADFSFRPNTDGIAGRAFLTSETGGWTLLAVAASLGRIVQLDFRLKEKSELETAIAIWRTAWSIHPLHGSRNAAMADCSRLYRESHP